VAIAAGLSVALGKALAEKALSGNFSTALIGMSPTRVERRDYCRQ
jgi:hypothetical protein